MIEVHKEEIKKYLKEMQEKATQILAEINKFLKEWQ